MTSPLPLKTRDQFVTDEIAAVQAALPGFFEFPIGSIVRAIVDAHGTTAIWEESLVQFVLARTRLATSTGADVDSFLADFGTARLPAVNASGNVTFASFSPTQERLITVGSTVTVQDGSISFAVTPDTTNPDYDDALKAYVMAPGTPSISAKVVATVAGVIGNVAPNAITVINSPIPGVDTVTNPLAFTNGVDVQSDPAAKEFFVFYLNSLSRSTLAAINYAVMTIPQVTNFLTVENTNYTTQLEQLGYFYVVFDDGSGSPPPDTIAAVQNAVEEYRGLTIKYDVKGPTLVNVTVSAHIALPSGYTNPNLVTDCQTALALYVNFVPFGGTLFYTRIAQIIYNVIAIDAPGLINQFNVNNVLLNGGTVDITSTPPQLIRATSIIVTAS